MSALQGPGCVMAALAEHGADIYVVRYPFQPHIEVWPSTKLEGGPQPPRAEEFTRYSKTPAIMPMSCAIMCRRADAPLVRHRRNTSAPAA